MPQIIVNISPNGTTEIVANDFIGNSCASATKQIEIVLGGEIKKKEYKPEYFKNPIVSKTGIKRTF